MLLLLFFVVVVVGGGGGGGGSGGGGFSFSFLFHSVCNTNALLGHCVRVLRNRMKYVLAPENPAPLTPSLPCCHLKKTPESAKFETLKPFRLLFALACERIFIKTHSVESRYVIGPENIQFAGASVHLSARKFYRLGQ